jgi:hypothetical protein
MIRFFFRCSRHCATIYEPNGRIAFVQRLALKDNLTSPPSHRTRPRADENGYKHAMELKHIAAMLTPLNLIKFYPLMCRFVLAMDVLEHLAAPHLLVSALAKGMQQKTKLIVTGPKVAYWHLRWRLLEERWEYTDAGIMDKAQLRWTAGPGNLDRGIGGVSA